MGPGFGRFFRFQKSHSICIKKLGFRFLVVLKKTLIKKPTWIRGLVGFSGLKKYVFKTLNF